MSYVIINRKHCHKLSDNDIVKDVISKYADNNIKHYIICKNVWSNVGNSLKRISTKEFINSVSADVQAELKFILN